MDIRRRASVAATQRAQRLAMAADLHDFVAHHVTGILMQARMAQMIGTTDPDQQAKLMDGVVHGATETLASMRRTVGFLRDSFDETAAGKAAADRRVGTLACLPELVEGSGGPVGPRAMLHRDPSVPDDLPYDVQVCALVEGRQLTLPAAVPCSLADATGRSCAVIHGA